MIGPCLQTGRVLLVGPTGSAPQLEEAISKQAWPCDKVPTPAGVLRRVRSAETWDVLVLVPGDSLQPYTELCRDIKFDARTALLSVVFAVHTGAAAGRAEIYEAGANDCILLPCIPAEIAARLSNSIRVKRATDFLEDSTAVITSLASAIEGRDAYTHGHVERVSSYAVEIGRHVGVDAAGLSALSVGGIVHDIGKVAIPDFILNHPGKLSDQEYGIMKRHPVIGYDILEPMRAFRDVRPIVRWHHECPNGEGYPDGLKGDELPLFPRIVAVADVFDAISTLRPYRGAFSMEKCREVLLEAGAKEELDPSLVDVFLDILGGSVSAAHHSLAPVVANQASAPI